MGRFQYRFRPAVEETARVEECASRPVEEHTAAAHDQHSYSQWVTVRDQDGVREADLQEQEKL